MIKYFYSILFILLTISCNNHLSLTYRDYNNDKVVVPKVLQDSLYNLKIIYPKRSFSIYDSSLFGKNIINKEIIDFIKLKCSYLSLDEKINYLGSFDFNKNYKSILIYKYLIEDKFVHKEIFLVNYKDSILLSTILLSHETSGGSFGGYSKSMTTLKKNNVFKKKMKFHVSDAKGPPMIEEIFKRKYEIIKFSLTDNGSVKQ